MRDKTRTKQRRKATVAQKAARDRGGNRLQRQPVPAREVRPRTQQRAARTPPPSRNAQAAARAANPRSRQHQLRANPARLDDFERIELRASDRPARTIDRGSARTNHGHALPDSETRKTVTAHHDFALDSNEIKCLKSTRDGASAAPAAAGALERAGLVTRNNDTLRLTAHGERVLSQLERQKPARETHEQPERSRNVLLQKDYSISDAQRQVINDLASFRIAREDALQRNAFGHSGPTVPQIDELKRQDLIQELRLGDTTYLSLTPAGREVAAAALPRHDRIHSGVSRESQARHDAAVYDAYQHAERAIRADGGSVRRIHLEEDLKADIRREAYISAAKTLKERGEDINTVTKPERNVAIREATVPIARAHGLPVDDDGAVIYPDMQLEIDRPDGTVGRCNVEVVTEHYSAASVAAKQGAGFQLYLPPASSGARGGGGGVSVQSLADELLDF